MVPAAGLVHMWHLEIDAEGQCENKKREKKWKGQRENKMHCQYEICE